MQKPLYLAHLTVLECAKNRKDNIQLQASWANQAWVTEIEAMFQLLEDEEVHFRLRLDDASQDPHLLQAFADIFQRMVVRQAAQRCWSMAIRTSLPTNGRAFLMLTWARPIGRGDA